MSLIKSLCVYCGSSPGRRQTYSAAAETLAACMVQRNIDLIYGGASIGIMGTLADKILELGGKVIGVIPEALAHKEVAHSQLTELRITHSMHERKMLMAELADAFIALPGGIGTLEELFEIWTWAQLGIHHKPCGLINVDGYYDALITFLDNVHEEGFVKPHHRSMLMVNDDPDALLNHFGDYQAPKIKHWVKSDET